LPDDGITNTETEVEEEEIDQKIEEENNKKVGADQADWIAAMDMG